MKNQKESFGLPTTNPLPGAFFLNFEQVNVFRPIKNPTQSISLKTFRWGSPKVISLQQDLKTFDVLHRITRIPVEIPKGLLVTIRLINCDKNQNNSLWSAELCKSSNISLVYLKESHPRRHNKQSYPNVIQLDQDF